MKITTIGLDLAKSIFQVHALMRPVRSLSASLCDGRKCCRSLPSCLRAWSGSRHAARRITGRVS